jgi:NAD(P)-dependent dehydrogenase (short-subunit alcohol dehydrogenase family)/acyl carrier protein
MLDGTDLLVQGQGQEAPGAATGDAVQMLAIHWQERALQEAVGPPVDPAGWLIVAPSSCAAADALAGAIEARLDSVPERLPLHASDGHGAALREQLRTLADASRRLVLFLGFEAADAGRATTQSIADTLIEAARYAAARGDNRLWVVTSGAQGGPSGGTVKPHLRFAWGAARSLAAEAPEMFGGIIDLDGSDGALLLPLIVAAEDREDEHLLHGDRHFVPRMAMIGAERRPLAVDPNGIHLVTGGLGGLAFELCLWLAGRGARNLLVVGRSALDPTRAERLRELRSVCPSVDYLQIDLTALEACAELEREIAGRGPLPLAGVYHLASSWQRDGRSAVLPLPALAPEDVAEVIGAKADGGVRVAQLASSFRAGLTVYFSSAAATIGAPGQVNYAGANGVLDGLAEKAASEGRRACSIAWGPIAGAGFGALAKGESVHELWEKAGIERLSLAEMFDTLEAAIASGMPSVTAVRLNDRGRQLPWLRRRAIYEDIALDAPPASAPVAEPGQVQPLAERIEGHLLRKIPEILSIPAESVTPTSLLGDVGVDSLVALELMFTVERELRLTLPYTEAILDMNVSIRAVSQRVASLISDDVLTL